MQKITSTAGLKEAIQLLEAKKVCQRKAAERTVR